MPGWSEVALGAAPIAGGAMLGALAGTIKGPDFRALIMADMDLLDRIPEESVELRAALRRSIDARVGELITNVDRNREWREAASRYEGNWRDFVLFLCAVLFTLVWWNVPHDRTNWLVTFVFLLILSAIVGLYATRGVIRAIGRIRHRA
ncbi:MAG: hypothetical protein E6Q56_12780 [Mycobacterium sp.]|nr:MAG: hypothetical protein E6Q56_12780 [Mycobacterium sp.]